MSDADKDDGSSDELRSIDSASHPRVDGPPRRPAERRVVWPGLFARIVSVGCVMIFVGLATDADPSSWRTLSRWGYLPAEDVWSGAFWALLTSAFVHQDVWHLAFNVWWLWTLGRAVEQALGPVRWLAVIVSAAVVTSAVQLAFSDDTGIGASGLVYALIGFTWLARQSIPRLATALSQRDRLLAIVWLVGCGVATWAGVWNVGNAAHVSGLFFGACCAEAFVLDQRRWLGFIGLALLAVTTCLALLFCPWSVRWLRFEATRAEAVQDVNRALSLATMMIRRSPVAESYLERALILDRLGRGQEALVDANRAIERSPRDGPLYIIRGHIRFRLGHFEHAANDYSRAIALKTTVAYALAWRCVAKNELGATEAALADCNRAIALDPTDAQAYGHRADVWRKLGKAAEAARDRERSRALSRQTSRRR